MASAPVRIFDVGGWSDTWFAPSPGRVCSIAAGPGVKVRAALVERSAGHPAVRLRAPDVGADLTLDPDPDTAIGWRRPTEERHPLLAHAVGAAMESTGLPDELAVQVDVSSAVPPGASLGTSSAVIVAVLAAFEALLVGHPDDTKIDRPVAELARRVHGIEVDRAGRRAGVQDAWPAAVGGVVQLVIEPFPTVRWRHLPVAPSFRRVLLEDVVTVALGGHDSSAVHGEVVAAIGGAGRGPAGTALARLSHLAQVAADALLADDVARWCGVLRDSTDAQAALHPGLVGDRHRQAIDVASSLGCRGWKVNGAGGDGGSLSVVAPAGRADQVRAALAGADPSWQVLDLRSPFPGVTVEDPTPHARSA